MEVTNDVYEEQLIANVDLVSLRGKMLFVWRGITSLLHGVVTLSECTMATQNGILQLTAYV